MGDYIFELAIIAFRVCSAMVAAAIALMGITFIYGMIWGGELPSAEFYIGVAGLSIFMIVSDALEVSAKKK